MTTNHDNILIELNKAVKTLNFYPKGHPNLEAVVNSCAALFQEVIASSGQISWTIDKKGIYENNVPIAPSAPVTASLAKAMFIRKIHEINFVEGFNANDLLGLVHALNLDPEEVYAQGGVEKVLVREGVRAILLNEMNYDTLTELKKEVDEEEVIGAEEEELEEVEQGEAEEEQPMPEESPEESAEPEQEVEDENSISALTKRIEKERDIILYNDLSIRILEQAPGITTEGKFDELYPALYVFCGQSMPKAELPPEIKQQASENLGKLLSPEICHYLIDTLGQKELDADRLAIEQMLYRTGEVGIDMLLHALVETREAHSRRYYFNTLVHFGERIRDKIMEMLEDERWFVTRQMVALLGELGGEESILALEKTYENEDTRVKKEVLKSLSRIHSDKSLEMLNSALEESDRNLLGQAIISLGILKDNRAVERLGEICNKGEREMRKEAIKALGMIGDPKAIPHLAKLAGKKVWFGKESAEDLRESAVISLSKIGGEEAMSAIEKIYKDSKGRVYNTCKRILEGSK